MELLNRTESRDYPPDYLQARISGRRTALISDWEPLIVAVDPFAALPVSPLRRAMTGHSPEDGWKNLLRETAWLYRQMDRRLRHIFSPLFGWIELRTLTLCLRHLPEEQAGKIEELLQSSLLSAGLQKVLRGGGEQADVLTAVTRLLATDGRQKRRLTTVYHQEGLAGFERELTDLYLAETAASRLHPLIRDFLACLIEARNIIILYKHLRWRISTPPVFIAGGKSDVATLVKLAKRANQEELLLLMRKLTGTKMAITTVESVERLLLAWITRRVRRRGREPLQPGAILAYLWRFYLEARNLGLLSYCHGAERELLRTELIQ